MYVYDFENARLTITAWYLYRIALNICKKKKENIFEKHFPN